MYGSAQVGGKARPFSITGISFAAQWTDTTVSIGKKTSEKTLEGAMIAAGQQGLELPRV